VEAPELTQRRLPRVKDRRSLLEEKDMAKTSLMEKLFAWGKFKVNLGKGTPVRELPTTSSKSRDQGEVTDFQKLKKSLEKQAAREAVVPVPIHG